MGNIHTVGPNEALIVSGKFIQISMTAFILLKKGIFCEKVAVVAHVPKRQESVVGHGLGGW